MCVCVCAMRAVFGEPPLPPAASKPVAATLRANVPLGKSKLLHSTVQGSSGAPVYSNEPRARVAGDAHFGRAGIALLKVIA